MLFQTYKPLLLAYWHLQVSLVLPDSNKTRHLKNSEYKLTQRCRSLTVIIALCMVLSKPPEPQASVLRCGKFTHFAKVEKTGLSAPDLLGLTAYI